MCNSGSSALYLAIELLDLPRGSEVVTAAVTFSTDIAPLVRAGLVPSFVDVDPDTGEETSAYWRIPRSPSDLTDRSALIEATTRAGGTMVTLIKEIGSDAAFALLRVLDGEALERAA